MYIEYKKYVFVPVLKKATKMVFDIKINVCFYQIIRR